jgi:peptide/nickel transport system substrate-binding protein
MMLKKIFIVVSVTALLLPFVLLTDVTDAQFTPRWGGTLVIADRDHPGLKEQTINPIIYYGYQYGPNDIFSRLVYYDHNTYEVKCDLAESWEYTSDWKEFTFHLRRDVKWHDGEPFTSADVKWHYEALIDAGGWQSAYFVASEMKPIETPDDYTVIFKFEKPLYPLTFADQHMDQFILPKHLYEGTDLSENPTNHHPIGTGPFKFVEWGGTEYYRMEANEDYYLGRPYLDSVVFRYFATAAVQTAILGLKKGELDVINDYLYISPSEIPGINAVPGIYARGYPYTTTWRIAYNFGEEARAKHPWLGDVRCRQALAMAIDRDKIIETLIKNQTTTTDTVISSTMPEYNDEAIKYKYDPEEAERLLDEAGYERGAGGTRFSFSLATYSSAVDWKK